MNSYVLAVLGGSSAFTPALASALADRAGDLPPLAVRMWGRRGEALAAVARFCSLHASWRGVPHTYVGSTDLDAVLQDADAVVCQVRVGGFPGRSHDESFPLAYGVPGDEGIGPSGLAAALRAAPVVTELARRSVRRAPAAPFVLMSNPLGILLRTLQGVPGLRSFGLCELPERTLRRAAALVGEDAATWRADYVGMNHQGAFVAIQGAADAERLPAVLSAIEALPAPSAFEVEGARMREQGLLWLPYARLYEHTATVVAHQRARTLDRGAQLAAWSGELLAHFASTVDGRLPALLARRDMPWNELALVPALYALATGRPQRLAVSIANGGHLPWLPADAVVEQWGLQVPTVTAPPPPRPTALAACRGGAVLRRLLGQIAEFERLAAAAIEAPSPAAVAACLQQHPLVGAGCDVAGLAAAALRGVSPTNPAEVCR